MQAQRPGRTTCLLDRSQKEEMSALHISLIRPCKRAPV